MAEARSTAAAPTARAVGNAERGGEQGGERGDSDSEGSHSASSARSQAPDSEGSSPVSEPILNSLQDSVLDSAAHENFPVATRLLPRRVRRHLRAVYAFARLVDDIGDETDGTPEDRLRRLDIVESDVYRACTGSPRLPVMRELAVTMRACDIPAEPFRRLVDANRQDQLVDRYQSFDALLDYCALSANPVGHIVLSVFNASTPERIRLSDRICTALQLVEHWQDVAEDLARGRVYVPAEDLARFGVTEGHLAARVAGPGVRRLMAFETDRAAGMLDEGAPLVRTLSGFPRLATAGYIAGGRAALAAIASRDHDVLASSPRPRPARVAREWLWLFGGSLTGPLGNRSGGVAAGRG